MAIDTNIQTFTDEEMLKLARKAIAEIMVGGQSSGLNGRQMTRADLPALWDSVRDLEARINSAATDSAGGIALVQYGER